MVAGAGHRATAHPGKGRSHRTAVGKPPHATHQTASGIGFHLGHVDGVGAGSVAPVEAVDFRAYRTDVAGHLMLRLGLDAIQRLDHPFDIGDGCLRLLGRHLQLELRVLIGVGLEFVQRLLGLGHIGIDRQRLAFLEQLLVFLELLLRFLQISLDLEQVFLFGQRLVQISDGLVEARDVGVERDLQPVLELGRDVVDLARGLGQRPLNLIARRDCRACRRMVRLRFGIQRLVENLLGLANAVDGIAHALFALRGLHVGILGLLRQFRAQLIGLPHQIGGLLVLLPAVGLARLRFQLRDL